MLFTVRRVTEVPIPCNRCDMPMVFYPEAEGDEWRCFNGHVIYAASMTPEEIVAEVLEQRDQGNYVPGARGRRSRYA